MNINQFLRALGIFIIGFVALNQSVIAENSQSEFSNKYDPARDPAKDLSNATDIAKKDGRYVMLIVGGEWCSNCHALNAYFEKEKELYQNLKSVFEIIKVNYSKENKNEEFLSPYPKTKGYPHFYIVNSNGEFITSLDKSSFEEEKIYSNKKFEKLVDYFQGKIVKHQAENKKSG